MQIIDTKSARLVGSLFLFGFIDILVYKYLGPFSQFTNVMCILGMGLQFYFCAQFSEYNQEGASVDLNMDWFRSEKSIKKKKIKRYKSTKRSCTKCHYDVYCTRQL